MEALQMVSHTTRMTLRLPNSLLEELKKEVDEKDLPASSLVVKILSKHALFERRFGLMPAILMSQALFAAIIENMDEPYMEKIAKMAPQILKKLASLGGFEYEIDSIIQNYFTIVGKYCGWYQFKHETQHVNYTLVFETGLGRKWTKFVSKYIRSILESLKIHISEESVNDNVIIFKFVKL
ncbi:MAG: hypothetical protein ACREAN_05475 [Nitrosopumilaceae archaeon]